MRGPGRKKKGIIRFFHTSFALHMHEEPFLVLVLVHVIVIERMSSENHEDLYENDGLPTRPLAKTPLFFCIFN